MWGRWRSAKINVGHVGGSTINCSSSTTCVSVIIEDLQLILAMTRLLDITWSSSSIACSCGGGSSQSAIDLGLLLRRSNIPVREWHSWRLITHENRSMGSTMRCQLQMVSGRVPSSGATSQQCIEDQMTKLRSIETLCESFC